MIGSVLLLLEVNNNNVMVYINTRLQVHNDLNLN